jgi:hypothetical protein
MQLRGASGHGYRADVLMFLSSLHDRTGRALFRRGSHSSIPFDAPANVGVP